MISGSSGTTKNFLASSYTYLIVIAAYKIVKYTPSLPIQSTFISISFFIFKTHINIIFIRIISFTNVLCCMREGSELRSNFFDTSQECHSIKCDYYIFYAYAFTYYLSMFISTLTVLFICVVICFIFYF